MPSYIASAEEAFHNWRESRSRWHKKGALPNQADGTLAFQRLRQQLFTPAVTPGPPFPDIRAFDA
jgi:hypothetical protein